MVHQQLYAFGMSVVVQHLDVEVRIRRLEIKDITLPHVSPVLPTYVPSLHKHLIETVLGGKVNIPLHLLVVGSMTAVGLHFLPVDVIELDTGELIGIVPRTLADNHLPPHATVLRGVNPADIIEGTRLVKVQNEV